ncbi:hypothetical protein FSARC_7024 [Fusarium sarcochroum]|uniref:Uncharacterized protein n=1 Tax=Fusarium sarcochroum TaxID=1208366 RepID=A0A8H4TW70_9HYPO|nr:hypothetical protein FSARC_7024 [Fusarium sarcochroum]
MSEQKQPTQSFKDLSSSAGHKPSTCYEVVKDRGSFSNPQASYGIGMDANSIEEANATINAYMGYNPVEKEVHRN